MSTLLRLLIEAPEVHPDEFRHVFNHFGFGPYSDLCVLPACSLREVNMAKEKADMQSEFLPSGIPNPKVDHAAWLVAMHKYGKPVSLVDYQQGGTNPSTVLDMMESSRRITMGCRDEVLMAQAMEVAGLQVNHYSFRPEAKTFWDNGTEEGLSPQDILDSWRAMQSIADEVTGKDEEE